MKLMSINEYCETRYTPNSRPSHKRITRLIRDGIIPGVKQGKLYYVDVDAEENHTGNQLVDRVLATYKQ